MRRLSVVQLGLQWLDHALVHYVLLFREHRDRWLLSCLGGHDLSCSQLSELLLSEAKTDLLDGVMQHILVLALLV